MKISFVIPAYNEETTLPACLSSLKKGLVNGFDAEIIVVNNASTDRTGEIARSVPGVIVVDEPKKGITWARQAGLQVASGDLVANFDADNLLNKDWLSIVMSEFERDDKLIALSGPLVYYDVPKRYNIATFIFYFIGYVLNIINRLLFKRGSLLQGGNTVVRKNILEAVGGYNTNIEFYGEDTELGRRLNAVGKVKWLFRLRMPTSGRRLLKEGLLKTGYTYAINFIAVTFTGQAHSKKHQDHRDQT